MRIERLVACQTTVGGTCFADGIRAETVQFIGFVGFEVSFVPVPVGWVFFGALPCEHVGGYTVEEPTVVRDDHGTAREFQQCVF